MRRFEIFITVIVLYSLTAFSSEHHRNAEKLPGCRTSADLEIVFSPGCTEKIVYEINQAKISISVLAYSYTSEPIGAALLNAKKRGVEVKVIVDAGRVFEPKSRVKEERGELEIRSDPAHAIMHQKVIVIDPDTDSAVVIAGSFNFTAAAEYNNAENINVIRSKDAAKCYRDNWLEHSKHSPIVTDAMEKEYFDKLSTRKELEADRHQDNGYSIWTIIAFVICFLVIKFIIDRLLGRK